MAIGIKLTTKEFVKRSRRIHGRKYLYSLVNYKSYSKKVKITCKKHGEFSQTPDNHLHNHGCPECGYESSIKNRDVFSAAKKATKTRLTIVLDNGLTIQQNLNMKAKNTSIRRGSYKRGTKKMVATRKKNNSFISGGIKGAKTRKKLGIDKEIVRKSLITKAKRGLIRSNFDDYNDYKSYYELVRRVTEKSYIEHKNKINPKNLKRSYKKYHVDHIFSVLDGYNNKVSPIILGHWTNLRMLSSYKNKSKYIRSHKSLKELYKDYNKHKND